MNRYINQVFGHLNSSTDLSQTMKRSILLPVGVSETIKLVANSVDPDQTPHLRRLILTLHCLLKHVCPLGT